MAFAIADSRSRKAQAEKSQAVPKPYGPFRIEVGHSQLEILTNVISELFSGIVWTLTYHSLAPSANATKNPAKAAPIIGLAVVCFACSGWFMSQILTGGWAAFPLFPRSRAHHDNVGSIKGDVKRKHFPGQIGESPPCVLAPGFG